MVLLQGLAAGATSESVRDFRFEGSALGPMLQQFAEQAGLQLIYAEPIVDQIRRPGFAARLRVDQALDRLLEGSGLRWRFVDERTVAILLPLAAPLPEQIGNPPRRRQRNPDEDVVVIPDLNVRQHLPWQSDAISDAAAIGRPLHELPRSVGIISSQVIDDFSLTAVEDLLVTVPGVFTTTRFGVQGSVDVRGVPADTYFRGMKRLTLQGHARSVLAAMDRIEVVAGPASVLYGLGKIGGYTNFVPKSGRARTGGYLEEPEGFMQLSGGRYGRREVSVGLGGPLPGDVSGGYYLYGMREDSGSFAEGVPVQQSILQFATSIDDAVGGLRLETGINLQESRTAGALVGRLTQDLVSANRYVRGLPLLDLDSNDNGRIGYLEMVAGSPVAGTLSAANQPLNQLFAWPRGPDGAPLPLSGFPQVRGIPAAMYVYLQANPSADPTGALRALGPGGPLPLSGTVPLGMVLDPRTTGYDSLAVRRSAAYEKALRARFVTAYADLISDENPDATFRNQFFFDGMDQFKNSNQPYSQIQRVFVLENKLTAGRQLWQHDERFGLRALATLNARLTGAKGQFTTADYGNHRGDAMADTWSASSGGMTPNTTFTSSNENATLTDDGLPWGSVFNTRHVELGFGAVMDLDIGSRFNLIGGARYDVSHARNTQLAGRFNFNTGTTAAPGAFITSDERASGWDGGSSLSLSLSWDLTPDARGYLTLAHSSILLDGNNNSILNPVIRQGHIGAARLAEAGIRTRWQEGRLIANASVFQQGRVDVEPTDDANAINAYATATTTRGWQVDVQSAVADRGFVSAYVLRNVTRYTPNIGGMIQVDARALGFQDVLDAAGNIIYPAEAFLYGGRARIQLPDGLEQYARKQGNPPLQAGIAGAVQLGSGWTFTGRASYLSDTCAGRLCIVRLPSSVVVDSGLQWSLRSADLKLDVFNIADRRYFRARTGDTLGDVIAQSMPGRRWQLTARYRF